MNSDSFLNMYIAAKKKEQVNIFAQFEELCKNLLKHNDINTFERIISNIIKGGYIINVSGVTCKLDKKSVDLCNKMFEMFSSENKKNPLDYSKNDDVLKFMENYRGKKDNDIEIPVKNAKKIRKIVFDDNNETGTIPFTIDLKNFLI